MKEKICSHCGNIFPKPFRNKISKDYFISDNAFEKRKYCSNVCASKENKTLLKIGENHPRYKEYVGYRGIHHWINSRLGKAKQCIECNIYGNRIHWANIDHKYKRDINDWIPLCSKCHFDHDRLNNLR